LAKSTKPGVAVNDKIDVKPAAWPSLRRLVLFLNLNRSCLLSARLRATTARVIQGEVIQKVSEVSAGFDNNR
jgi:hypothetical protein